MRTRTKTRTRTRTRTTKTTDELINLDYFNETETIDHVRALPICVASYFKPINQFIYFLVCLAPRIGPEFNGLCRWHNKFLVDPATEILVQQLLKILVLSP